MSLSGAMCSVMMYSNLALGATNQVTLEFSTPHGIAPDGVLLCATAADHRFDRSTFVVNALEEGGSQFLNGTSHVVAGATDADLLSVRAFSGATTWNHRPVETGVAADVLGLDARYAETYARRRYDDMVQDASGGALDGVFQELRGWRTASAPPPPTPSAAALDDAATPPPRAVLLKQLEELNRPAGPRSAHRLWVKNTRYELVPGAQPDFSDDADLGGGWRRCRPPRNRRGRRQRRRSSRVTHAVRGARAARGARRARPSRRRRRPGRRGGVNRGAGRGRGGRVPPARRRSARRRALRVVRPAAAPPRRRRRRTVRPPEVRARGVMTVAAGSLRIARAGRDAHGDRARGRAVRDAGNKGARRRLTAAPPPAAASGPRDAGRAPRWTRSSPRACRGRRGHRGRERTYRASMLFEARADDPPRRRGGRRARRTSATLPLAGRRSRRR